MFAAISAWCLALAIGQAPQNEAKRLDAIPSEVQIVVRFRGLQPAHDDLIKMLEAMSPNLAAMGRPSIDNALKSARDRLGKTLASAPMLFAVRLPAAVPQGIPPKIAILVESNDYDGAMKALAGGGKPEKKKSGVDAFTDPNGVPSFAAKGTDFIAVGSDEDFVAEIVKPKDQGLGRSITGDARDRLFEGDLGLFVNLAAIQEQYGDQIDKAREGMIKQMEQQTEGNPAGGFVKSINDMMLKAFKSADVLALSVEFAPAGLIVKGEAIFKKNSEAIKTLATAKTGDAASLGNMPASLSNFTFMRFSPGGSDAMLRAGAALSISPAAKETESFRKATALMREAGAREIFAGSVVSVEKPYSLGITSFDNPRKGVEALLANLQAVKEGKGLVKDVEIVPKTRTYRGFELSEIHIVLDLEKISKLGMNQPNPAVAAAIPKPPEKSARWFGTDGKVVLNVAAPTWEEAKSRIDSYLDGKRTIGEVKGFQAARKLLPTQVGSIFLLGAQNLVGDYVKGLAIGMGRQPVALKLPADPVFIGASLSPTSKGYHFRLVVPNDIGPIIEGVLPALHGAGVQQ